MSRRATTFATFKWLEDALPDLIDYCACYGDMSLTFVIRKAVKEYLAGELQDKQKLAAFAAARKARMGVGREDNVRTLAPKR